MSQDSNLLLSDSIFYALIHYITNLKVKCELGFEGCVESQQLEKYKKLSVTMRNNGKNRGPELGKCHIMFGWWDS